MKMISTVLLSLIPNALIATCLMHPNAPPELSANHDCCRIAQEDWEKSNLAFTPSAYSIYQVASLWKTQDDQKVALSKLAGRPQLLVMAYTNCQYACPMLLADMKSIESAIPVDVSVGFTIVSIDPERDTPERLKQYAQEHDLDLSRWTLLHGDQGDVLELANLLGVRYAKTTSGDFSHSNLITLLNSQGEVVMQQNGLGTDNSPTLAALAKLSED